MVFWAWNFMQYLEKRDNKLLCPFIELSFQDTCAQSIMPHQFSSRMFAEIKFCKDLGALSQFLW